MEQDTQSEVSTLLDYNDVELDQKNIIQKIKFPDASVLVPIHIDYNGDGIGEVQYENGGHYHGELQGASPNGFGIYSTDEMTIIGMFADQTLDGIGAVCYQNSSVTAGTFQSGQLTGYGSQYEASQQFYYAGQYRISRPNGLGTLVQGDISKIYANEWQHCLQFGTFVEGSLNGRGVSIMATQSEVSNPIRFNRYEGYFTYGVRDGSGALFLANGEMMVGNFRRGVKNGLFAHVSAQGSLTLRFYDGDVVRRSYYSVNYYVQHPHLLRCLQFDALDVESYDAHVAYFKNLEAGTQQQSLNQHFPSMDTLFRLCRRLTAPLQSGVCEDPRVCQPLLSECITETVRCQDGGSLEDASLFRAVDDLKSAVINGYDVFKFLFDFYRARDKFLQAKRDQKTFPALLGQALDTFCHLCEETDAAAVAVQQAELLARQQEFERAQEAAAEKEKDEEEAESESNENKAQLTQNNTDSPQRSLGPPDNNTPLENHSVEGPEVNLDGTDRNPASPLRHSNNVTTGADGSVGNSVDVNMWPKNGNGYATQARAIAERTLQAPLGVSETDNELLRLFCVVLDAQQQLSRGSALAMIRDMACVLGLQREFRGAEASLAQLAMHCSAPADSALMLTQFGVCADFGVCDRVFNLEHFVCFLLQAHDLFGVKTAISFIQNQLTQFARKIMEGLATVLADDQEQLDHFLESLEARQGISTQSTRRLGTAQTAPDTKSVYTAPRSQISKVTKNTFGSIKSSMTIPRVLVRDFSYQLSDVERALMRTTGLTNKVANLYEIRQDNQRGLLFHTQINEQLERLITQEYGGLLVSRLDLDGANLSLLQLLQLAMNSLSHFFGFPAFDDDVQFYANVLIPFYLRYTAFDVYQTLFEIYNGKQKAQPESPAPSGVPDAGGAPPEPAESQPPADTAAADEGMADTKTSGMFKTMKKAGPLDEDVPLQDFYEVASTEVMTPQKLLGLLSCFFLKSTKTYQQETEKPEVFDPDEQTSQLNSEDMAASIRSDNSLYSKNQTLLQEQQQMKDKTQRQDAIQQCMELQKPCVPAAVIQIAGDFLNGLEAVIYDQ